MKDFKQIIEDLRLYLYIMLYLTGWIPTLPFLFIYSLFKPQNRAALASRLGLSRNKLRFPPGCVWVHACSVGEVRSIVPVIEELKANNITPFISTTTTSGYSVATGIWPDLDCSIFPYDFFAFFQVLTARSLPNKVIVVETEIWPGMLAALNLRGIAVSFVNARISDDSYSGYSKIAFFLTPLLRIFSSVFAQSDTDALRLERLGAHNVQTIPNLKYWSGIQGKEPDACLFPRKYRYLVAGSTHQGEEEIILNSFQELKKDIPNLRLILAPRHIRRVPKITNLLKEKGRAFSLRTRLSKPAEITLLDTVGELNDYFLLPGAAFIGGSLVPKGGHNPLEPVYAGKIPVMGPYIYNCRDMVDLLKEAGLIRIAERETITETLLQSYREQKPEEKLAKFLSGLETQRDPILRRILFGSSDSPIMSIQADQTGLKA